MRRLLISLTALGLFGTVIGCHHTSGICDCAGDHGYGSAAPAPAPVVVETTPPITVMPRVTETSAPPVTPGMMQSH